MGFAKVVRDNTLQREANEKLAQLNRTLEERVNQRTRELMRNQERLRAMASDLILTEQRERRRLASDLHDYLVQILVVCQLKINQGQVYRWLRQYQTQGSVAPRPRGKYAPRKLDDGVVAQYIAEHPDATLAELGEVFAVSGVAIWKACQRVQITRKTNASVPRTRRARSRTIPR